MGFESKALADSINSMDNRLMSMRVVFPRYILAEMNTHRMFSRNSASSRAIPFKKMVRLVKENPFIPMAWMKDHSGMQGTVYFSKTDMFDIADFLDALNNLFENDIESINMFKEILQGWEGVRKTLDEWWLIARDRALESAILLACFGVTKQLCNRILEPFMWHTVIITSSEFENFFALRCPKYEFGGEVFRSKRDVENYNGGGGVNFTTSDWLNSNKGQADIHMMQIAELMWDTYQESVPRKLKDGEWHIPFGDQMDEDQLMKLMARDDQFERINTERLSPHELELDLRIKIATARCARISYQTFGDNPKIDYEADIKLHDSLAASGHWSPFEHLGRAMTQYEYVRSVNGLLCDDKYEVPVPTEESEGWSGNFKGFIQYRKMFPRENIK